MARGQATQDLKVDRARFLAPERGALANGTAKGRAEPDEEITAPLTAAVDRLTDMQDRLDTLVKSAAGIAERLYGPVPELVGRDPGPAPHPALVPDIHNRLGAAYHTVLNLENLLSRIWGAIQ